MKVVNDETDQLLGHTVNLTGEGFMLTGEDRIDPDVTFRLKMVLPAEIKGTTRLVLQAVSRWCEPDEDTPQFYNTGFRLKEPSKQDLKVIKRLMKKYCF